MSELQEVIYRPENRRIGQTEALIKVTKQVNGMMVFQHEQQAKTYHKEFKVSTCSLRDVKGGLLRGVQRPILFDHTCLEQIEQERWVLEKKKDQLLNIITHQKIECIRVKRDFRRLFYIYLCLLIIATGAVYVMS